MIGAGEALTVRGVEAFVLARADMGGRELARPGLERGVDGSVGVLPSSLTPLGFAKTP